MDDDAAVANTRTPAVDAAAAPARRALGLLRVSGFLRAASSAVVAELAAIAVVRELVGGQLVWREGDPARYFHVIGRGLIAVRRNLASGSEVTLGIFGPGENVGDTAALEAVAYPADAVVASDDAIVVAIPARRVLELSLELSEVSVALQQALLRHNSALRTKVAILSAGTVRARLANLFLHLAARFGDEPGDGTIVVPLPLSRTALASLVSARAETVIRALRPWEDEGVVRTVETGFVIGSPATLQACSDLG